MDLAANLEKLSHFLAIVETGSIGAAARSIPIAQPALSYSMKVLEESLGVRLFHRSRKGIELTNSGEVLLRFSKELMQSVHQTQLELKESLDHISGDFHIGTHELYVGSIWPRIVKEFENEAPKVRLKLATSFAADKLLQDVSNLKLDAAIAIDTSPPPGVLKEKLYEDTFDVFAGKTFHLTPKTRNLEALPLVYLSNSIAGKNLTLQELLENSGFSCRPKFEVSTYASAVSLIGAGLAVGILPKNPASYYKSLFGFKSIRIPRFPYKASHSVCLYFRKYQLKDARLRMIKQLKF